MSSKCLIRIDRRVWCCEELKLIRERFINDFISENKVDMIEPDNAYKNFASQIDLFLSKCECTHE